MKKILIIFLCSISASFIFAQRRIRVPLVTVTQWCGSPSTVGCAQTCQLNYPQDPLGGNTTPVNITVSAFRGNTAIGYNAIDSTKTPLPVRNYTLTPGDSVYIMYSNLSSDSAKEIEIVVAENTGYLLGSCMSYYYNSAGANSMTIPIAGGRPF